LAWLRRMSGRVSRLGSVCTGALLLATSGLLEGRRATTHWAYLEELKKSVGHGVCHDAIYTRDGNIYTSAGVTAGMDMALAMRERSFARHFVDGVGLAPGHYVRQIRLTAARQRLEQTDLPLQQIARRCGFGTPESLRRSFIASVGVTPGAYRDRFRGAARPAG